MKKGGYKMNILVYFKQIPDEEGVTDYQDVGFINESDKNVLIEALNLRDEVGGTVTVMVMGPKSGEKVLKEALTWGIDEAVLIEGAASMNLNIGGAARVMAAAIRVKGSFDIILCGRQAIDGDAAHMAGMTASYLSISQISYSRMFQVDVNAQRVKAIRYTEEGDYLIEAPMPVLIMSIREQNTPRYPLISDIMKTYNGEYVIHRLGMNELKKKEFDITKWKPVIQELDKFQPETNGGRIFTMLDGADEKEKAHKLLLQMHKWGFL